MLYQKNTEDLPVEKIIILEEMAKALGFPSLFAIIRALLSLF
jgi:hypothetical protein